MSNAGLFAGMVEAQITSADMDGVFDLILRSGFRIYSVLRIDELTTIFTIQRDEYNDLQKLLNERGEELCVNHKAGVYWTLKKAAKRPILYISAIILLLLTILLPSKVLFYTVSGNTSVPDRLIIDAAAQLGFPFGTNRKAIRNEIFKNGLISLIPEIEWAGINTVGCVAEITVREKECDSMESHTFPSNIIAVRDAVVTSVVVSKGSVNCAVGEAVLKGQLLISGYTDCGKALLLCEAKGEIYGYTSRELNGVVPLMAKKKVKIVNQEVRYSIVVGKKRINLWKGSGICPTTCDRIYKEYWVQLPGGYKLPVCLIQEKIQYYDAEESAVDNADDTVVTFMTQYLQKHMSGGQILHQDVRFLQRDDILIASGVFGCHEMIGQQIREELGDTYG